MLDLKKIEENFKILFEQETEDSFNEWLIDKRKRETFALLGKGKLTDYKNKSAQFEAIRCTPVPQFSHSEHRFTGNTQYAMAA